MIRTYYDSNGRPYAESYEDHLVESLKDPAYAKEYLNAALEDDDYRVFLLALRDVATAFGIKNIADEADLNRENIYKMVSPNGNPRISSLIGLLRAVGVRLKMETAESATQPPEKSAPKPRLRRRPVVRA